MPNRFLFGAAAIADFLFDNHDANHQQRVFYLVANSDIPVRKVKTRLVAYSDDIIAWVRDVAGKKAEPPKPQRAPTAREKRREIGRQAGRARWQKDREKNKAAAE